MIKKQEIYQIEPELQEYIDFLNDADQTGDMILTTKKVDEHFEEVGQALNILLAYPDLFFDIMKPTDSFFQLFPYQRIALRSMARHRQTYMVATRGASKSFLAFGSRFLASMCIPNHHSFVCANLKNQASAIATEKLQDDLWVKFPLLNTEMSYKIAQPGKNKPKDAYYASNDKVEYNFAHGGRFDVVSIESARGKRRHSGLIEEVLEQNGQALNEKIVPLMNIYRRNSRGMLIDTEPHAAKIYITTAGYHDSFAYEKFLESLCYTVIDPKHFMVISMTYKIPMMHGLIDQLTIREVMSSPSFEKESFEREYESKWSGSIKGAAFDKATIRKTRKIIQSDLRNKAKGEEFYVVSADMAKDGAANTAFVVLKITPRDFNFLYQVINAGQIASSDYAIVANELKMLVDTYDAEYLIYDANGIGAAIRDWLNKDSFYNGEMLPGLGIINPPKESAKDVIKYPPSRTKCYELKVSSGAMSGNINMLFFGRLKSGSVKMLVTFREAIDKYGQQAKFNGLPLEKRQRQLRPYQFVDKLEEELLNLDVVEVNDNGSRALKVKRRNNKIQKDFFSALSYGIYVVHENNEIAYYNKRKRKVRGGDFIMCD